MLEKAFAKLAGWVNGALGELYSDVVEHAPMCGGIPWGTVITRIACGDSISVALTDKGLGYSWGTFNIGLTS